MILPPCFLVQTVSVTICHVACGEGWQSHVGILDNESLVVSFLGGTWYGHLAFIWKWLPSGSLIRGPGLLGLGFFHSGAREVLIYVRHVGDSSRIHEYEHLTFHTFEGVRNLLAKIFKQCAYPIDVLLRQRFAKS